MLKKNEKEKVKSGGKRKSNPNSEPVGRPREHDRKKIAQDMIEWCLSNPEEHNLLGFSEHAMIAPTIIIRWAKNDEEFCQTYDLVRSIIGRRREKALASGSLHVKAYDLNAQTYDQYLKAERREDIEYALEKKAAIDQRNGMAPNDDSIDKLITDLKKLKHAPQPKAD